MMHLLISGSVQVSNDIDVYLQPLLDDLLVMWAKEGVRIWGEYKCEHFYLPAMLFTMVQWMHVVDGWMIMLVYA
jgi:hypothetical protein